MASADTSMSLSIQPFHDSATGTWTYLIIDSTTKRCVIIDPVLDFDIASGKISYGSISPILSVIQHQELVLDWILETHAHADHLTAADHLKQTIGGKTVIGQGIKQVQQYFAPVFNFSIATDGSQFDRLVAEGDTLTFGNYEISVYETPGHTSDGVIYKIDNNVFLGDTFFHPNSGTARCDFPGGNASELFDSLSKILSFADDTQLWLCHDYPGNDREAVANFNVSQMTQNIHLANTDSKQEYVELRQNRDAQLSVPKLLYPALQVNICAGQLPKAEQNGANYLKLPLSFQNIN